MANEAFVWGRAGRKLTPDQVAKEREAADLLAKGAMDYSPVAHWSQGLNRVAQGLLAGIDYRMADKAEEEIGTVNKDLIASLLSGGSSAPSSAPTTSSAIPMTSAAGEVSVTAPAPAIDISGDKQTFIASLLPAAIEESKRTGVDPRIIVAQAAQETGWGKSAPGNNYFGIKSHGKGGGQSLMTTEYVDGKPVQVRDSFRGYASPADSVRGYGDFILENPRYRPLREAQGLDAQLAALGASGYATDPNYASSVGAIARGIQLPTEVAAATPEAAIEAVAPLEPPVDVAAAPAVAEAVNAPPVQVAQASGINPAIIEALTNPQATPQTQRIAAMLLQQEQEKQQMAEEQRLQAADPLRQLQIRKAQAELDQLGRPQVEGVTVGNRVIDRNTGRVIYEAPQENATFRQATPEEAQKYGSAAGQFGPDGKFYPINPPQGTALSVGPNGEITFNQGAGVKPLTEAQSKDTLYATRATNALPLVDRYEQALMSLSENLAEGIPLNLGNYAQSEEYQVARDAGRDFLATILRKDTGAAITAQEENIYGKMFLPQPGDKPAAIQAKRQRRALAVEAIKAGMPATAIENMAKALDTVPPSTDIEIQTDIPGVKIRRKN